MHGQMLEPTYLIMHVQHKHMGICYYRGLWKLEDRFSRITHPCLHNSWFWKLRAGPPAFWTSTIKVCYIL